MSGEDGHLGGWIPLDQRSITPDLWRYLNDRYQPSSMLDLGCGEAWPVLWFLAHGVPAVGVDGSLEARAAAVVPPTQFVVHDFARGPLPAVMGCPGLTLAVEFVEHVEEQHLPNILDIFARSQVVAMSHAWPGQPGHHHVNCQAEIYWVAKLHEIGLELDHEATRETRAMKQIQERDAYWGRSGLVFVRA